MLWNHWQCFVARKKHMLQHLFNELLLVICGYMCLKCSCTQLKLLFSGMCSPTSLIIFRRLAWHWSWDARHDVLSKPFSLHWVYGTNKWLPLFHKVCPSLSSCFRFYTYSSNASLSINAFSVSSRRRSFLPSALSGNWTFFRWQSRRSCSGSCHWSNCASPQVSSNFGSLLGKAGKKVWKHILFIPGPIQILLPVRHWKFRQLPSFVSLQASWVHLLHRGSLKARFQWASLWQSLGKM